MEIDKEKLKYFSLEYIDTILNKNIKNHNELKKKLAEKYKIGYIPKNNIILSYCDVKKINDVIKILNIKPTRKLSGVTVVALFAKPHFCPHGKCLYCPGGPNSEFGDTPQSYTGKEPAAMRAIYNNYDPYLQVFNRLEHYVINGHLPDKIEAIVMGGTFPSLDKEYRDNFINFMYKAFNDFGDLFIKVSEDGFKYIDYKFFNEFFELPYGFEDKNRKDKIQNKILEFKNKNIKNYSYEIKRNEKSKVRCIGLTIETRPDWGLEEHCNEMLEYGTTRFELGVQSLYNNVLKKNNRGHSLEDTKKSFQIMKDFCFKINAHMMLGLYGSNDKKDLESIKKLFEEEYYRPDMIKFYPCLLIKGTPLYKLYERGLYKPIDTKKASEIIGESFKYIPKYVRVMRIQRDIPTTLVSDGIKNSNLRQFVENYMKKKGIKSKDIRAREVGFRLREGYKLGKFEIKVLTYKSSGGKEYFISIEDENETLLGFVRLRVPSKYGYRKEIIEKTGLIRELHVYGKTIPVGIKGYKGFQHKGWGKKLMKKAEEITKKNGCRKIVVISGVGVREYYKKLGYYQDGPYMSKKLSF